MSKTKALTEYAYALARPGGQLEPIVGRLLDTAAIESLPKWLRDEIRTAADKIERGAWIAHDASEIIGEMAGVIVGMYVIGPDGSHNGKPYRDIAAELKAAENAAEVRAALGLPPNAIAQGREPQAKRPAGAEG